jgi:site-specific DNA-methyltransferase (adenine-specific)
VGEVGEATSDSVRVEETVEDAPGSGSVNVVRDEGAARELDRQSGELDAGAYTPQSTTGRNTPDAPTRNDPDVRCETSDGGASRYFYTSKASKAERNIGLPDDEQNEHPTVKPVDLMRWLVQLVTAEGQVVVDPFAGSGTTLIAADFLGREWVGVEKDEEHAELARRRVENYDASEVKEWIDDETVTQAEQAGIDAFARADGGDNG